MKLTKTSKFQKSFKLLLSTSFLFVTFLCFQCVTEKPVAQTTNTAKPPIAEKKIEPQGPALKTENIYSP